MRRLNNLVTLFCAIFSFFFGGFLISSLNSIEQCAMTRPYSMQKDNYDEIFLMIAIISAPDNFERRQIIRKTWLKTDKLRLLPYPEEFVHLPIYNEDGFLEPVSVADQERLLTSHINWLKNVKNGSKNGTPPNIPRIKHFFAVGTKGLNLETKTKLKSEYNKNRDLILLESLTDSYKGLTKKLLYTLGVLVKDHNFQYLLKTDDDTYVKLDFLLNELITYDKKLMKHENEYDYNNPAPELYWGFFTGRGKVNKKGKWKENNFHLCSHYMPYAFGGGYIITRTLVEYIDNNAQFLNAYASEDVSVGVWLAPLKNVYRKHDMRWDTGAINRKCQEYHMVLHKKDSQTIRQMYVSQACPDEKSVTNFYPEYTYDWKQLPSKCCDKLM